MRNEEGSDYCSVKLRLETHLDNPDPSDRLAHVPVVEDIIFKSFQLRIEDPDHFIGAITGLLPVEQSGSNISPS